MTSQLHYTLTVQTILHTLSTYTRRPYLGRGFTLWPAVFDIQGCWKSEKSVVHRMTPERPWTLNNQKYPLYLPPRPKFWSVSLYDQPYSYKIVENRNFTEWLQYPVKLKYSLEVKILVRFTLWPTVFEIQGRKSKTNGNAPNDLRMTLNSCQENPVYAS